MTEATVTATATEPELLATDRCDSCGAQALVRVTFLTGTLLFCRHHARKNHEALARQGVSIFDPDGSLVG
jgi:hypothetical protein